MVKRVQNETDAGGSTTRTFDTRGNLTSITRDGVRTSYTYDAQGNVASATFPRGLVHTYSNYRRGIPQYEAQPAGIIVSRLVSDAGNVRSETNGEGRTTSFVYDGLNRIVQVNYPSGNPVTASYGAASRTVTRGALTETTAYDGLGRTTSVTLGGIARTYSHDALGRRTFESNPGATIGISYQYDLLDRTTRITYPDSTFKAYTYGAGTVAERNERGHTTTYAFRAYGDPDTQFVVRVTTPDTAASLNLTRNVRDLVTSVSQGGTSRSFGYNANYYLTSETHPETGATTYGRDAAGNMTSRSVGASGTTTYSYDGQNRLTSVTYPGATPSVTYAYSRTHKLRTITSSAATRTYGYDPNDNLISESLSVDGLVLTAGYTYNANDQLSSITYPRSGQVVSYAPNALGRPTMVSGYVNSITYWPSGQIRQINYANGTSSTYNQNSRLWPSSFSIHRGALATPYINSTYTYDGAGNLTSVSDSVDASYNRTLGYDALNRLTVANGPWGTGGIAYTGTGNVTSQVFGAWSLQYSYNAQNRLSGVSGARSATYGYDAYGNVISGGGNTYTYDGVPNLRCVNCGSATNRVEYFYDGLSQRVMAVRGSTKTYEVHNAQGLTLIEFTPSQQNKLVEYIYLGGKRIAQRVSN
ncbi:RHS repeat protein [Ectothiorhodospiraceae bacterium 2226]|nr:RHS repeat protein [Ectothiorhodospiraceae bacterium 2226]